LHSHFSNDHFSAAFASAQLMQNAGRAARVIDQSRKATKPAQALWHLSRPLHQARQQILADRIAQQDCALLNLADGLATAQLPKPDYTQQRHPNRLMTLRLTSRPTIKDRVNSQRIFTSSPGHRQTQRIRKNRISGPKVDCKIYV